MIIDLTMLTSLCGINLKSLIRILFIALTKYQHFLAYNTTNFYSL